MAAIHENLARGKPVRGASNRAFGGVFVAVFLAIGVWPLPWGGEIREWVLVVAAVVLAVAIAAPAFYQIGSIIND